MKLQTPFIQLPLHFDAAALAREIEAVPEHEWRPHPQGFAGNSMLPLVAVDGDPSNESFCGKMRPTPILAAAPLMRQALSALGATVGRTRLMRLSGQAEVTRHADQGYYWTERVRVHIPVVTQPAVRFECGGEAVHMAAGECWIFDTWRQHRVVNAANHDRIHLVVDTVGGAGFWQLVAQGCPFPSQTRPGWQPARVVADASWTGEFGCESMNIPEVMTPWELGSHMSLLFTDVVPHPALGTMREITSKFVRAWQGLWFEFGTSPEGRDRFRQVLAKYLEQIEAPARGVRLVNELPWFSALMTIIGRSAVGDPLDPGVR